MYSLFHYTHLLVVNDRKNKVIYGWANHGVNNEDK